MVRKFAFVLCVGAILFNFLTARGLTAKITVHPENPHYMIYNGEPVILFGGANVAPSHPGLPYKEDIDRLAALGSNFGRIWTVLPWEGTEASYPWARTGPGEANDGGEKFDLTVWDENYWNTIKAAIEYAKGKGIILQYMVFDECGLRPYGTERWNQHPFNPDNNINNLELPQGDTDAIPEFYDLQNAEVLSYQEAYVDKVLKETSHYDNLIYEIVNEITTAWDWQKHFIDYIHARCDTLIANNPEQRYDAENLDYYKLDIVNKHGLKAGTVNSWFISNYASGKALKYDEQCLYDEQEQTDAKIRSMGWESITGGGHINWDESGNIPHAEFTTEMISKFFRDQQVGFVDMEPQNELTNKGYALVNKGFEYIIYNPEGGTVEVNLTDLEGLASIKWYDPKTGEYSTESLIEGGQEISFEAPFSGDVVLYIRQETQTPPLSPTGLRIVNESIEN